MNPIEFIFVPKTNYPLVLDGIFMNIYVLKRVGLLDEKIPRNAMIDE